MDNVSPLSGRAIELLSSNLDKKGAGFQAGTGVGEAQGSGPGAGTEGPAADDPVPGWFSAEPLTLAENARIIETDAGTLVLGDTLFEDGGVTSGEDEAGVGGVRWAQQAGAGRVIQPEFASAAALLVVTGGLAAAGTEAGANGYRELLVRVGLAANTAWVEACRIGLGGCLFAGMVGPAAREIIGYGDLVERQMIALAIGYPTEAASEEG